MENALPRRTWSLCMTSENHGTVGPAGCKFSHAPEKHERVLVVEVPTAAGAPADQINIRLVGARQDLPVAEFEGYVDGEPLVRWMDRDNMPRVGTKMFVEPVAEQAAQVAPAEELARFCPACGSVGDVGPAYRDCCPDGNEARRIPKRLAEKCRELFNVALSTMRAAAPAPTAHAAPAPIQSPSPTECWSVNEEGFSYDSLAELLDNHPELVAGSRVFVGEAAHPALNRLIDSDDVIDQMSDRADDIAGEYADGYPDVSAEDKAELDTLLAAWIAKSCPPTFYEVKNVRVYIITEQDISGAQASTSGERQEGGQS